MFLRFTVFSVLLSSSLLFAQPAIETQISVPGGGFALIYDCVSIGDAGFAYAGQTFLNNGPAHAWLVRSDAQGENTISYNYGGDGPESAMALVHLAEGNLMLAGGTSSFAQELRDIWLLKVNYNGDSLWSRNYSGERDEWAIDIATTSDGGLVLLALSMAQNGSDQRTLVLKLDRNYELEWTRTFISELPSYPRRIIQTDDGGYMMALMQVTNVEGTNSEYCLKRLTEDGELMWESQYSGVNAYRWILQDMVPAPDGGFALVGYAQYEDSGEEVTTTMVVITDAEGSTLNNYEIYSPPGTPYIWQPSRIISCASGGYAIAGAIVIDGYPTNGYLFRLNEQGFPTWFVIPPVTGNVVEQANALAQNADGDFIICGQRNPVEGSTGGWICRTAPDPDYRHYEFDMSSGLNHTFFVENLRGSNGLNPQQRGLDVAVMTQSGLICGTGQFWGYEFSIIAWSDDEETEAIEGFTADDTFSFKAWDPETETDIPLVIIPGGLSGDEYFQINGYTIVGLELTTRQNIELARGWNLISLNIVPQSTVIRELMAPLLIDDRLLILKNDAGQFYYPMRDFNNISHWNSSEGYQIKVAADATFSAVGSTIPADRELALTQGWSIIPYYPTFQLPPAVAIETIAGSTVLIKNGSGQFYLPSRNYSNMGAMRPGQGFWIKLTADATLIYPVRPPREMPRPGSIQADPIHFTEPTMTGSNMSLLLTIEGLGTNEDSEIGVYTSTGLCVGAASLETKTSLTGLAVWADDPTTPEIDGAIEGEALSFRLWDGMSERDVSVNWLEGDKVYTTNGLSILELADVPVSVSEFALAEPYPNPFNNQVRLSFALPEAGLTKVAIYNLAGQQVASLLDEELQAGKHSVIWNGEGSASGIYVVKVLNNGKESIRKVALVR